MSRHTPSWFIDVIKEDVLPNLPSWFTDINKPQEMPEEVVVRAVNKGDGDWTQTMMAEIRSHESPNYGYSDYFGRGFTRGPVAPPKNLEKMTLREVSDWQVTTNPPGNDTSAAGAYQIINRTLNGLIRDMGLTGAELFSKGMQDRMAIQLMEGRGLRKFLAGGMDREAFGEEMAKEWASIPVLRNTVDTKGRPIKIGQSIHVGDGVNKAFKGTSAFEKYKNLYEVEGRALAPKETNVPEPNPKREAV